MSNKEFIVTDTLPLNRQKGTLARIFLWNSDHTEFIDTYIPHLFTSKRLSHRDAETLKQQIERNPRLKDYDIKVELKPSGKMLDVVQVRGTREIKNYLGIEFWNSGSVDQALRWQIPTFSKASKIDKLIAC